MVIKGRRIELSNIILGFIYTSAIITAIVFGLYMYKSQYSFFVEINEISISLGEKYKIEIIAEQENKVADYKYIYKSKNQNIASVDSEGYITPNKVGTTEVEITSKKSFSTEKIVVNVLETGVETISFNGDIKLKINEMAKCYPIINGDTSFVAQLTYRSEDESIARVDEEGNITALSEGRTNITATANNGVTGSLLVIVESETIEVIDLSLEPSELTLSVGDSKNLTAKVLPTDATNQSLTWISSNSSIVNVTQDGIITAKKEGKTSIVVKTTNGLTKTANITVKASNTNVSATNITLNSSEISLKAGETYQLKATISPSNTTDQNITWTSSDTSIATVNANGVVTGKKSGTITITSKTSNGKTATCSVTVYEENIDVTDLGLSQTSTTVDIGNSTTLVATVLPNNATNKSVSWSSSDSSIVEVSQNGVITAKKAGTATITVTTTNGKTKQCIVTVPAQKVLATAISLNKTTITMYVGKNEELIAAISPSNTTDKNITWTSSDTSIATVNVNGVITAKKAGSVTITAKTSNGKTATCKVTVKNQTIYATSISLNKTTLTVETNQSSTLTATISPSNTTDKNITWTSSDTSIATVSNGKVTGKKAGTATITAKTSNGKTATCKVTVQDPTIYATSIKLNQTSLILSNSNKTSTLTATIAPSNTTNKTVTWTSSNPSVATVNSSGVVTAKSTGTTTIMAKTSNGKITTCNVTVQGTFTNSILDRVADPYAIWYNGYYYLMWTPADCSNKGVDLYRTKDLTHIEFAGNTNVTYRANNCIWAPEIHQINGYWYIYYSDTYTSTDSTALRRMHVLKSKTTDIWGEYEYKGIITDSTNKYAIDGTVLQWNNQLYFIWSGKEAFDDYDRLPNGNYVGRTDLIGRQNIYIAHMSNPWTIDSEKHIISTPTYSWEGINFSGTNPNLWEDDNNEGPQVLIHNGTLHIMFSANAANQNYALGMLTYTGGDIMSQSSWQKYTSPLFKSGNGVYGPGHASYVKSPDGTEDWIVYHAYRAVGIDWNDRDLRIQKFTWNGNTPVFGSPIATGTSLNKPSGTPIE